MSMSRLFGSPWSSVLREVGPASRKAGCVPDSAPAYGSDAGGEVIWTDAADGTAGLTEAGSRSTSEGSRVRVCHRTPPPGWYCHRHGPRNRLHERVLVEKLRAAWTESEYSRLWQRS